MPERLVLSRAASSALATLSRSLLSATRTASLYPAEHPVVAASVDRVMQSLTAAANADVATAISVTPSALIVRGADLASDLAAADLNATMDLAALLHGCGILEIGFDGAVPRDAVVRWLVFIARLATAAYEGEQGIGEAWQREGHPAIRIVAVDYRTLLADRATAKPATEHDDLWRALVSALRAGRRTFDAREQQRLMDVAGDPDALVNLAETLIAEQCTPDGAPLLTTQATTILACFRHLASVAAVIAPDRAQEILRNLAAALSRLDAHVSMQVLALDGQASAEGETMLAAGLDEEGIARIVAAVVALEGGASPRLAQVFELLVPDPGGRRRVLEHARSIAAAHGGVARSSPAAFDAFWKSLEILLLSYDDQPFVSDDYRVVLDANRSADRTQVAANLPEMPDWLETLGEASLQHMSITLLADLLRLEQATDRAVVVLNDLAGLAEHLLLAGAFDEALRVVEAISGASRRDDLATAVAQVLDRLGAGAALAETAATIDELDEEDWLRLERCYLAIGPSTLASLASLLGRAEETPAIERAGRVVAAMAEASLEFLGNLLNSAHGGVRLRLARLLGRVGRPAAIPALQKLLRTADEPGVLEAAVAALAAIDDPAAARALHLALAATDGEKRQAVVNALVGAHDRRVVPLLVRVLEECQPLGDDFQVALHTLDALARLADPRAVAAVTRVMLLRSWLSRRRLRALKRACVQALSRIADTSATGALQEASRSGDRMLRGMLRAHAAPAGAA